MAELANCSRCGEVFVKGVRDICERSFREEEKDFETVLYFLRDRKNRKATMQEIVAATAVEEKQIIAFIKEKRLLPSEFPNLSYPCTNCGAPITSGKLCFDCSQTILEEWKRQEKMDQRQKERQENGGSRERVYYSVNRKEK